MIETIELAIFEGRILCGFATKAECKEWVRTNLPGADPFDVTIETQYLTKHKPGVGQLNR